MAKNSDKDNIVPMKRKKRSLGILDVDFILLFTVLVLLVTGLTMLFSTTSATNMSSGKVYAPIIKQSGIALVGLVLMFMISTFVNYKTLKRYSGIAYIAIAIMMILVAFIGLDSHGARRQIALPFIGSLQPSEFSKYIMIICLATRFSMVKKSEIKTWKELFTQLAIIGVPVAICLLLQRHASAALVHLFVGGVMLIAVGADLKKLIPVGLLGGAGIFGVIMATGFRVDRITGFLNQSADVQGNNWQATQAIYAVGSGGLFGLGLGNGRQKYSYLPEAENDYIFAIVGEELGFIGSLFVVLLFCIVIWRGITIALNCKDTFGTYTAFGITVLIGFQVLINMCVVLRLIPSTGMQLPLFSLGGSSMLVTLIGFGILLAISRENLRK
ncbi:MAG: cell division protein FtsW [Clostridia bacterium]|nr:cell division protein FtsW [Clostridia bacterium]